MEFPKNISQLVCRNLNIVWSEMKDNDKWQCYDHFRSFFAICVFIFQKTKRSSHGFVQGIKVACEITTSIWQKKNVNGFEQFWVGIWTLIQNPDQITQPSIDLKVVLKRKLAKDFKKVSPICSNLSYKSQLVKVWSVLSWNFLKKLRLQDSKFWPNHPA